MDSKAKRWSYICCFYLQSCRWRMCSSTLGDALMRIYPPMWYYRDVYMNNRETVRFYEEKHEISLSISCWNGHMSIYDGIYNFAGDKLPLWCHGSSVWKLLVFLIFPLCLFNLAQFVPGKLSNCSMVLSTCIFTTKTTHHGRHSRSPNGFKCHEIQ